MSEPTVPAYTAIQQVLKDLKGIPAFLAGSSVAAMTDANKAFKYSDVDVFTPNPGVYFMAIQHLLNNGYEIETDHHFERTWERHVMRGFNKFHTNSMKLLDIRSGTEVNIIYKLIDQHPTTRLSALLESFDFGLLAHGYNTQHGDYHDMRTYFFGKDADDGRPLPLLPYRREDIERGYMSRHVMLRSAGRYARYAHTYGHDLSLVKPVLLQGYRNYVAYKQRRTKPDDIHEGNIAEALAAHIEFDEFDQLLAFEKTLPTADGLEQIFNMLV